MRSHDVSIIVNPNFNSQSQPIQQLGIKVPVLFYVRAIFDFGFFTFMMPFRIVFTKHGYKLYSTRGHTVVYIFVQILVLYETTSWIVFICRHKLLNNCYDYIILAHILGCFMFRLVCIHVFYGRRKVFQNLLQKIQRLDFLGCKKHTLLLEDFLVPYGILVWSILNAVAELSAVNLNLMDQGFMGGKIQNLIKEARWIYLFEPIRENSTLGHLTLEPPEILNELSAASILFSIIHFLGILPHYVCMISLDKTVLILAFFSKKIVHQFLVFAKTQSGSIEMTFQYYEQLKLVFDCINEAFGIFFLCLIGGCLPFYPMWASLVLFHQTSFDYFQLAQFLIFFGTLILLLNTAANVTSQMEEFYAWVSSCTISSAMEPTAYKLTSLLIDMNMNRISLKGGNLFRFSYPFLGTVLSIIITYTFIILQLQLSKNLI